MSLITQKILKCCEQDSVVVLSEQGVETVSSPLQRVLTKLQANDFFFFF